MTVIESALPSPGDILAGKYRVDSTIGQGGMGVVLGAFDHSLGRPVAIKVLAPSRAASEAAASRFLREARAAAAIQSDHVVRVHEVASLPSGLPFIVMEHLRGSDLSQVLQARGGLPLDYACDLVLQTCEALSQAHRLGIVHRDLKPQNLFLTERSDGSPCVKVLDFGISTAAADAEGSSPKLTSTDMVMGTPLYMSPEQVRSLKNVDARADIWALGAILFELLAATPPFDGPSASALHAAIAMDPPQSLRVRRPDLPPHVEAAIMRCLEKDPARRFQTVEELSAAIAPFASERGKQAATALVGRLGSAPTILSTPPLGVTPRPSSTPAAGTFGSASTMDLKSSWQQATGASPAAAKSSSLGLVVGLALGGVALLAVGVGVAAVYFKSESPTATTTTPPVPTVSEIATPAPTPTIAPEPAMTTTTASSVAPVVSGRPAPPTAKDGGAPAATKDAGAPSQDEKDRAVAQTMQPACHHAQQMQALAKTDDERKAWARNTKLQYCHMIPAVRCERSLCREACTVLNDEGCRLMLQQFETGRPAKY